MVERKAAADAAATTEAETPAPPEKPSPPANANAVPASDTDATSEAALLEERKDAPIVEAVTELPDADEIPRDPDDLGISISDTNDE